MSQTFKKLVLLFGVMLLGLVNASLIWAQSVHTETAKGISLFESGDTAGAITTLLVAVKAQPDDPDAWHFLGRSYNRIGKSNEAVQAFQQAVKLRPSFVPSRVGLALALQRVNKLGDSSREAEGGLKVDPKCDECHYVLSLIALKKNDQRESWRHAALALKINPTSTAARDLRNQALVNAYSQTLNVKLKIDELRTQGVLLSLNLLVAGMGLIMDPSLANQDFRTKQGDRFDQVSRLHEDAVQESPDDPDAIEWRERLNALRVWRSIVLTGEDGLRKNQIVPRKELTTEPVTTNTPAYNYPDDFRQAGIKGRVILGAILREDGRTESIFVLEPLHALLTQEALTAARQQTFKPATKDGKPVKTLVMLGYRFGVTK